MARRPGNLDLAGLQAPITENGHLTPRRPNFYMDLPSPRAGEIPPALSPLDAFALHSRALAKKLEESTKAGRRMSRLPHHEIQTELAKRPGYFRSFSGESGFSEADDLEEEDGEDDEEEAQNFSQVTARDIRPVSHYPFLGNISDEDERPLSATNDGLLAAQSSQRQGNDGHGYFGIQVPRSSSPEPFDGHVSKHEGVSPGIPSLTSSIDSIGSSQPRTLTNESCSKGYQGGLAPPRSPLRPRSARSIASIRSVIDSGEEDNSSATGFEAVRKSSKASTASNPHTPLTPDFLPISRSPSAMSEVSISEPLPRPSFNFSRPRSSSGVRLAVDRRPAYESRAIVRKPSNGSSLREAISVSDAENDILSRAETLSIRGPSRQNSGNGTSDALSKAETLSIRAAPSRQNSGHGASHTPVIRGPFRQNSGNTTSDTISVRGPSRQNSGNAISDTVSVRGPSRQNSDNALSDTLSRRAPSRQNSSNAMSDTASRRSPSRQNSGNVVSDAASRRAPSRQNSDNVMSDAASRRAPSRQNSGNVMSDTASRRAPSRQNSSNAMSDTASRRAPSRQNSSNAMSDTASRRAPSRQNSSNAMSDTVSVRALSRQNSANGMNDRYPIRAPSRQNSENGMNDRYPVRAAPSRQNSGNGVNDSRPIRGPPRQHSRPRPQLPRSNSEAEMVSGDETRYRGDHDNGAPSYTYSKYSLPRGRTIERNSAEARDWIDHQFKWEEAGRVPPQIKQVQNQALLSAKADAAPPSLPTTPTKNEFEGSINRSRSAEPPGNARPMSTHRSTPSSPSITSTSTDRTVRGRPHVRNSPSQDIAGMSPEQHLEKGIEFHNSGSLSKSTYHLRLAARAGLPTAMLLYALACRHGWGMRPNQTEGVSWLKRAVDSSSLEFMADNDPLSVVAPGQKQVPMTAEQKTRKAQFALAIYELGMSYMNGWGIPKDKSLALRCFEIAGSWGDNDALAEAGFCYVQGIGCKKDAKKAAGFYRRAADGGMSMAGNSWIWKPKYMEDPIPEVPEPPAAAPPKAGRSRAKSFFGRKKPPVVT